MKKPDNYRDRAAERRGGVAGDYAQVCCCYWTTSYILTTVHHTFIKVEALAEDFERRNADQDRKIVSPPILNDFPYFQLNVLSRKLEEQRKYLGGDSTHTVLVKGLDFALLEQNKARVNAATEDDDTLEQAFIESSSSLPKKRTREEIVAELKNKRVKGDIVSEDLGGEGAGKDDAALEEGKKAGKFKPIGFKPIGETEKKGKKKVIKKVKGEGKKKKVKEGVTCGDAAASTSDITSKEPQATDEKPSVASSSRPAEPEPEPVDEDFDIFAGAGEYTGLDLGDDDEDAESDAEPGAIADTTEAAEPSTVRQKWVDLDEEPSTSNNAEPSTSKSKSKSPAPAPRQPSHSEEPEEGEEPEDSLTRLMPLSSSMSIRDILAADAEEEKAEKRRARKEKKKKGGDLSAAGKVDRDYQRYVLFSSVSI